MNPIKKVYGYVTRMKEGEVEVLVFQHPMVDAGIQIPKGTVKFNEDTKSAVIREMEEETGLRNLLVEDLIAEDFWKNDDGLIHNRFFYKFTVKDVEERWDYQPTGGGEEEGLTFHYFWISSNNKVELIRGHGDYLELIFD
ncbi:NUDIX hydrolase [Salipaludibacillus daqingensis]|uniref:NUDIX hydrolase n=1 Tax=Salipaludibacillus daqingensis TaxID=3041001 RepID=UPI002475DDD9|nr:NUDIX domain-containing protein [Salipaludibacillus daqingensis]